MIAFSSYIMFSCTDVRLQIALAYACFLVSYVGIVQIRSWVGIVNSLSACSDKLLNFVRKLPNYEIIILF